MNTPILNARPSIETRPADQRGVAEHGWLSSRHTFSFAHYDDPKQRGFSDLLVINDDTVAPGAGFGMHPHRDMEIFSYVLDGVLEHKDTMGNGSQIRPGDVQMISAGRGIAHSEFNGSQTEQVKFLQSGDGLKLRHAEAVTLAAGKDAEVLVFVLRAVETAY